MDYIDLHQIHLPDSLRPTADRFSPERCVFESNFRVDRYSGPYQVL